MSSSNKKIRCLIDSANFQKECLTILNFVSDICEIPQAMFLFNENNSSCIVSKKEMIQKDLPENITLLNQQVLQELEIKIELQNSFYYIGIPVLLEKEETIGIICLTDTQPHELSPIQLKTIHHARSQMESLVSLHLQNSRLQLKEVQLQLYIDNSKEVIFELETDGTICYLSKSGRDFIGFEGEEILFQKYETLIHPEDRENCKLFLEKIAHGNKTDEDITYRLLHKEGHYLWCASTIQLIETENRIYFVGNCRDITEYIEARMELTKQKEFYEKILDCLPTDVAVFDNNHRYLYLNPVAIKNEELRKFIIGKDDFQYAEYTGRNPSFAEERRKRFLEAEKTNTVIEWIDEIKKKDNTTAFYTRKFAPVFNQKGELEMMVGFGVDITAQKNAEAALKISNERFSYSSKATSDAIWDWNMMTNEIFVGESYSVLFGYQFENNTISADVCETLIHPEDREDYNQHFEEVIASNENKWTDEYRYLKSDGTYVNVSDKAIIIRDLNGKPIRMIGAMRDITFEKKLKDELQESEEQFKGAFENSAVGMALINSEGYYIEVNQRLCDMLGYTNSEMKLMTYNEITHHKDIQLDIEYKEKLDSGILHNLNLEKRFIHKNASVVWVHMSVSLAKDNNGKIKHYIVQMIDITERKNIEKQNKILIEENNRNKNIQLNEAKNMYRLLADNTVDLVCLHNLDTTFEYISPSIVKLMGYAPEELIGEYPMEYVHPRDLELIQNSYTSFLTDENFENAQVEARFRNKNGDYVWFEIKANIVQENGVPISFQTSARNITQQKEVQYAMKKALAQERELNELRTNLVSTISHEFRTPMTTIRASAELIEMYIEGHNFVNSAQLQKRINTITEEIDRIVELMNAVLTISKDDAGKTNFNPAVFDLKQICLDVIETSYSHKIGGRKVQTFFEGDEFTVFADKNLMEYSLFNLLNNAFKYSEGTGDIILNLTSDSEKIAIQIIDFGIGIPEKDIPKLFNTFFRASNTEGIQGTGLGLYIVKTFTERNFGTISVKSELEKGTQVTLQFSLHKS